MQIFLVLFFSLLCKFNCENSEEPVEPHDKLETELKGDETDKNKYQIKGDEADKMNTVELKGEAETDKNKLQSKEVETDKIDKELTEIVDYKINENNDQEKVKGVINQFPGGDVADLFGTNQHYNIPANYPDFGRRFVLQYPYFEKKSADEEAEDDLHDAVQQFIENKQDSNELLPIKAPPEFVLAIAKKSAILEATKPKNPSDDVINKDILRSGNYWNDVWKEEIDPKKLLRSSHSKNDLQSVSVEIKPGSKLYNLISILKLKSPRLLYVINKDFGYF